MKTTENRRVLVTGASRGLGLEFVRQLLARGDSVIAACRDPDRAQALQALRTDGRLHLLALDVTDDAAISAMADAVRKHFPALDLLVNNAGVLPSGERFGQVRAETLRQAFDTNAVAPLLLAQALAPVLAQGREATVLNISTVLASIAATDAFRTPSYSISKAALNMAAVLMSRALAEQRVRVVNLHPGWVRTDMGGKGATLDAEDSVRSMLGTLDRLPRSASGVFLDRDGEPLPW